MGRPPVTSNEQDLAWARALAAGERDALERYERELVPMIDHQLRRRDLADDEIAEVQQVIRTRLLVGDGDGPAITAYEGRGSLRSWVLVSALREAVRTRHRGVREPTLDDETLIDLADRDLPATSPEKERYRGAFREAFRGALAALSARDRVLLRMHAIDGLSIDQIGALQGVHRATAARWIESARESVSRGVRREIMKQLGMDPFEADELLRWVQSRIDITLSILARDGTGS
jgi:RNA polymerase sigma-70 factor (ECF subfamily)